MKFAGQTKEDEDGSGDRIGERFSKNLADVFKNLTDVLKDISAKKSKRDSRKLSMSTVKDGQSRFSLVVCDFAWSPPNVQRHQAVLHPSLRRGRGSRVDIKPASEPAWANCWSVKA